MNLIQKLLYALISSLFLSIAWYEWGSGLFLLVAFIPLLLVEDAISNENLKGKKNGSVFLYASLTFLFWNILTTWWIKNASFVGLVAAVLVTTLLMSVAFLMYSILKRFWGRRIGYAGFILFWIMYEFAYNHGEISWPWLTLGNGFLFSTRFVQWYEFTGVFGGSLWILTANILLFELIRKYFKKGIPMKDQKALFISLILVITLPIATSLLIYHTYEEKNDPREIVVVQPNIDPYMKFNDIPQIEQTKIQISEAAKFTTHNTDYVVAPETSISGQFWIDRLEFVPDIRLIRDFQESFPKLKYIVGIYCYERYASEEDKTKTARPLGNSGYFFDTHNSAIQLDSTATIPIYHKSMLVTGVEKMPYTWLFKPLEKLTLQLGGIFRSHGIQDYREVFSASDDNAKIAPVICYESVFGEFVGEYINEGANIIFVITNDGWWGDTPGHRQHNGLSCIRAIESRRSIARSANTGISCFIDQRGEVLEQLTWWKRGAIKGSVNLNNKLTFYSRYGDYIGRTGFYLAIVLLLVSITKELLSNFK
jgi:apolipoprotein N-acyltransferase